MLLPSIPLRLTLVGPTFAYVRRVDYDLRTMVPHITVIEDGQEVVRALPDRDYEDFATVIRKKLSFDIEPRDLRRLPAVSRDRIVHGVVVDRDSLPETFDEAVEFVERHLARQLGEALASMPEPLFG